MQIPLIVIFTFFPPLNRTLMVAINRFQMVVGANGKMLHGRTCQIPGAELSVLHKFHTKDRNEIKEDEKLSPDEKRVKLDEEPEVKVKHMI